MCFICIYTLYNDVLSLFSFFVKGVFDAKRGVLKIFEDTPPIFQGGTLKKWTFPKELLNEFYNIY